MKQPKKKKVGEYQIYLGKKLGSGGFGDVFEGLNTNTNQLVAVKMMPKSNRSATQNEQHRIASLRRQALILSKINSNYVVGFRDIVSTTNNYYIIQEKCDGDLKDYLGKLRQKKRYLTEQEAIQFMTQILNGFYALIVMNVIHRDIKPENFLMKEGKIKIADFGLARRMNGDGMMQSTVGTTGYQSPQILEGEPYTNKCDVFSIGCVFYELLYDKKVIYSSNDKAKIRRRIDEIDDKKFQFPQEPLVSEKCKKLIWGCLRKRQQDRISWLNLFEHQLFKGRVPSLQKLNIGLDYILSTLRKQIEIRQVSIEKFLQKFGICKDKQISLQDYTKLVFKIIPAQKGISLDYMRYSFNYFDKDENGKISFQEFAKTLKNHGTIQVDYLQNDILSKFLSIKEFTNETSQKSVKIYEQQNLGEVEQLLENINKAYRKLLKQIKTKNIDSLNQKFNLQDLTQDGLDLGLFRQFLQNNLQLNLTDQQCGYIFKKFDENGDNKISFQEFNRYVCNELQIKKTQSCK